MGQNYLHGTESPQINAFLAATGWNLKKMMLQLKEEAFYWLNFFSQIFNLNIYGSTTNLVEIFKLAKK